MLAELAARQTSDADVAGPRNFRANYYIGDDALGLVDAVHRAVLEQNVLYAASSFPSLKTVEREIGDFALSLLNAPDGAVVAVTTGGSESNFMALKTARDYAAATRGLNGRPEIVLAHTAHPSIEKAAQMLGMVTRRAGRSRDYRADPALLEDLVGPSTAMIVASAPPAAYATVDPVPEIAALAERHDLWLHVDGCMGGLFLPFAEALGEDVPTFDFRLPAVRSMSADFHKFGYAPKGVSALLLRHPDDVRHRDYVFSDWPFGHYATTGVAGSRPAAPMVAAWAVMRHLGRDGYLAITRQVLALRKRLERGVATIEGLSVIGSPACAHLFVAGDERTDIFAVDERLSEQGYLTARAFVPDSIQLWVSLRHNEAMIDDLLTDLDAAARVVRRSGRRASNREGAYTR